MSQEGCEPQTQENEDESKRSVASTFSNRMRGPLHLATCYSDCWIIPSYSKIEIELDVGNQLSMRVRHNGLIINLMANGVGRIIEKYNGCWLLEYDFSLNHVPYSQYKIKMYLCLISSLNDSQGHMTIFNSENVAFVSDVLDISNPRNPVLQGSPTGPKKNYKIQ